MRLDVVWAEGVIVDEPSAGVPCSMVEAGADAPAGAEVHPDHAVCVAMGKRYITADETLEVLCVKAGDGSLAVNGDLLLQKDTKQLPKTD